MNKYTEIINEKKEELNKLRVLRKEKKNTIESLNIESRNYDDKIRGLEIKKLNLMDKKEKLKDPKGTIRKKIITTILIALIPTVLYITTLSPALFSFFEVLTPAIIGYLVTSNLIVTALLVGCGVIDIKDYKKFLKNNNMEEIQSKLDSILSKIKEIKTSANSNNEKIELIRSELIEIESEIRKLLKTIKENEQNEKELLKINESDVEVTSKKKLKKKTK